MLPPYAFFLTPLLSILFFTATLATPTALLAPLTKDPTTLQYKTLIHLKTPLKPTKLVLDLTSSFLWLDCHQNYTSSSSTLLPCHSPLCTTHACTNTTCNLFPENPITHRATTAIAHLDTLALHTTDGHNPGPLAVIPNYLFSCSPTTLLKGLAKHVSGIAALGRSNFSLPSQISSSLSFPRKFAVCLSGSPSAPGLVFFGDGPYFFLPEIDISRSLTYTPLIVNSVDGHLSDEYFVGVTSIRVNEKSINLNSSLLSINKNGQGGTKFSTVVPYTTLHTSIYNSLSSAFITEAAIMNITRVDPVKPFKVCFSSENVLPTRVGLAVPTIDLVLQRDNVFWRIFGANSMVQVEEDVVCLGFLDGGLNSRASIVVGGYQLEDNLVQFDLEASRLGFSSSLLFRETACANFNFTSTPNV